MSELALFLVRIGFVAVLWIFIFSLLSVIRADIYGRRVVSSVARASAPQVVSSPLSNGLLAEDEEPGGPSMLAVVTGVTAGQTIPLDRRELYIGRAASCDLVITDEFASSQHAKLVQIGGDWIIQDLNSTNGTYLDGARVGTPQVVRMHTPMRVGKTTFELRP